MLSQQDISFLETSIGYEFTQKHLLQQALISAGAVPDDYDGNRKLANLGTSLIQFLMTYLGYEASTSRSYASNFAKELVNKEHCAALATRLGIDRFVQYNQRQKGEKVTSVTSKAFNAMVGAVFIDSGENVVRVLTLMLHVGAFTTDRSGIDPATLTLDNTLQFTDIRGIASTLLGSPTTNDTHRTIRHGDEHFSDQAFNNGVSHIATTGRHACAPLRGHDEFPPSNLAVQGTASCPANRPAAPDTDLFFESRLPVNAVNPASGNQEDLGLESSGQTFSRSQWTLHYEQTTDQSENYCDHSSFLSLPSTLQVQLKQLGGKSQNALLQIAASIASPESILTIQEIIRTWRSMVELKSLTIASHSSTLAKFESVRNLDSTIAYSQLLRRYYILEIFKDVGGHMTRSSVGQVLITCGENIGITKRAGNPANLAEAEVTSRMMREIHPLVMPGTNDYKAKSRSISRYRKLGQRFHVLESSLGKGVLALFPNRSTIGESDLGVSDTLLLQPTDAAFKGMVEAIDESCGDIVRQFSHSVSAIVDDLVYGLTERGRSYRVEQVEAIQIANCYGRSNELLQLISD